MQDEREAWRARLAEPGAHDDITRDLALLQEVDLRPPPAPVALSGWLRVAAWNLQRGRHPGAMADVLRSTGADLVLLSEADVGMARSGNADVPALLGEALGMGGAFGVEFVELGLGTDAEAAELAAGAVNDRGLHGNAILARAPLLDAKVARIELRGRWFAPDREPRVGGRLGVVATVHLDGVPVTVASVHLESESTADERAEQLAGLLDAFDDEGPAVVGGDLNCFGATYAELADRATVRRMRQADPARFSWPVPYEPLFQVAADRGFDWLDANVAAPTTEHDPDGAPHHHPLHIDWILTRGLEARRPTVVPAVDAAGRRLSDHRAVAVSVRLPR